MSSFPHAYAISLRSFASQIGIAVAIIVIVYYHLTNYIYIIQNKTTTYQCLLGKDDQVRGSSQELSTPAHKPGVEEGLEHAVECLSRVNTTYGVFGCRVMICVPTAGRQVAYPWSSLFTLPPPSGKAQRNHKYTHAAIHDPTQKRTAHDRGKPSLCPQPVF